MRTAKINISVTDEIKRLVTAAAQKERLPVSRLIERVIIAHINTGEPSMPPSGCHDEKSCPQCDVNVTSR